MKSLPPRPPSPTELSYTQLAKLAPRFGSTNKNGGQGVRNSGIISNDNVRFAIDNVTSTLPTAPRTAPPSTINVPSDGGNCSISTTGGLGVASSSGHHNNYQTPNTTTIHSNTMSAPIHRPRPAPPHQYTQQQIDPTNDRSTPVEDRLTNLATKLHTMQQPISSSSSTNQSNLYTPMMNNLQSTRNSSTSRNLQEVQQFIDTLKNMQAAVSNTVDEQSRLKKSRALNALLSMFERIIEDTAAQQQSNMPIEPIVENKLIQLEQRVQQLERENSQLQILNQEKNTQLQQVNNELQNMQQRLQQNTIENEQLKIDATTAQDQCHRERQRATEAEAVAAESENVRDSMLSNYARLTEENVELQQSMEHVHLDKEKMVSEIQLCQQEMNELQTQCNQLTQSLQHKDMNIIELEKKMNDLNDQLISQQNLLQSANNDRQRLQDELHNSQRNSTTASQQLMNLRGQFSQFRRESDSRQSHQRTANTIDKEEHLSITHNTILQEEQQRRRILEMSIQKAKEQDAKAQEEMQRISESNADLKNKVDELNAQLNMNSSVSGRSQTQRTSSSIVDEFSITGDSIMNEQSLVIGNNSSPLSLATMSQHSEASKDTTREELPSVTTDIGVDQQQGTTKQRSQLSAIDELSLDGLDSIMNPFRKREEDDLKSPDSGMTSKQQDDKSSKEDEHPNLMDYFYNQIKLAE